MNVDRNIISHRSSSIVNRCSTILQNRDNSWTETRNSCLEYVCVNGTVETRDKTKECACTYVSEQAYSLCLYCTECYWAG